MSGTLRSKRISTKKLSMIVYAATKRMLEAVKFLVTNVKKANLKMLCTALCYSFYQMMTLKVKGIF